MEKEPIRFKITFPYLGIVWIILVLCKIFGLITLNWFFVLTFPIWAVVFVALVFFLILIICAFFMALGSK